MSFPTAAPFSSAPSSLQSVCESTPDWKARDFWNVEMDCDYNKKAGDWRRSVDCDTMVDPVLGPATEHCCKCKPECFDVVCNGRTVPMSWEKPITVVVLSIVGTLLLVLALMYAWVVVRNRLCRNESEHSAAAQQSQDNTNDDNVVVTALAGTTNDKANAIAVRETANLDDVDVEGAEEFHSCRSTQQPDSEAR